MWNYNLADKIGFQNAIDDTDWDNCFNSQSMDVICESISNNILDKATQYIPNKSVTVRPYDKPFYNGYLRRLKRKLNKTHGRAKLQNCVDIWERYRDQRNVYFREVKRCKNEYLTKIYAHIDSSNINSKTYFKLAKETFGFKGKSNSEIPPIVLDDNTILTNDLDKAEAFNNFFTSASKLDTSKASLPVDSDPLPGITFLNTIVITTEDVYDQIKNLDTEKGYGPDKISPKMLKMAGDTIVTPLTRLFNKSLETCIVPKIWKLANVLPLHKKNSKEKMGNYRPVSLLSTIGKIMERIMFKYIYNHFHKNFLLSIWQSGFRPGSSTVTQLLELYNSFCAAVEANKEIRIVFLDISKAFDRVWHQGLIYKLKKWGISGQVLDWLSDYLKDRFQRVVVNGQKSEWNHITAGVPQGSVLGPLLFLVFINDITDVIKHCKIRIFADDTCLFITVDNSNQAAELINEDLKSIEKWANKWLVKFSPEKTESMLITLKKHQKNVHPPLFLKGALITNVDRHKHVGVWLDSSLSWSYHINEIVNNASTKLNLLNYFKFKSSRKTLESMYFTFIRPLFEYACVLWAGSNDKDLNKLEKLQVDAMRIVTGATKRSNISNLYKDLRWVKLSERRNIHCLIMLYKIINGQAPQYLINLLPQKIGDNHNHNLRNRNDYYISRTRLETFNRSYFPRTLRLWNNLDFVPLNCQTLSTFKNAISKRPYSKSDNKFFKQVFNHGNRYWNINLSRLRIGCSKLNQHLCNNLKVIENPNCMCGAPIESVSHFFFQCPIYKTEREQLFLSIADLTNKEISINLLLNGERSLSININFKIIDKIHVYLEKTNRFS